MSSGVSLKRRKSNQIQKIDGIKAAKRTLHSTLCAQSAEVSVSRASTFKRRHSCTITLRSCASTRISSTQRRKVTKLKRIKNCVFAKSTTTTLRSLWVQRLSRLHKWCSGGVRKKKMKRMNSAFSTHRSSTTKSKTQCIWILRTTISALLRTLPCCTRKNSSSSIKKLKSYSSTLISRRPMRILSWKRLIWKNVRLQNRHLKSCRLKSMSFTLRVSWNSKCLRFSGFQRQAKIATSLSNGPGSTETTSWSLDCPLSRPTWTILNYLLVKPSVVVREIKRRTFSSTISTSTTSLWSISRIVAFSCTWRARTTKSSCSVCKRLRT